MVSFVLALVVTEWLDAAVRLCGAGTAEDMSEEQIEHFEELSRRPLDINAANVSKLLSSGLFSEYMAASLADYRERTGDILSWTELSLVDGFNAACVGDLKYFVILESQSPPGKRKSRRIDNSLTTRVLGKSTQTSPVKLSGGIKYTLDAGERFSLKWSCKSPYGAKPDLPGTLSTSLSFKVAGASASVVAGGYQARFGQGLVFWSGTSFSGFSGSGSFGRSTRGVSPTGSYSPGCLGIAAELTKGRWCFDSAVDFTGVWSPKGDGPEFILSGTRYFRSGHVGANALLGRSGITLSTDGRWGTGDVSFFGEAALEIGGASGRGMYYALAGVAGILWIPYYGAEFSALLRCYPSSFAGKHAAGPRSSSKTSDETGVSAYWKSTGVFLSADTCFHPSKSAWGHKFVGDFSPRLEWGRLGLTPQARVGLRLRPGEAYGTRLDLRTDLNGEFTGSGDGVLCAHLRWNGLRCQSFAHLTYAEAGWRKEVEEGGRSSFRIFGRWTLFKVDNWNDRIYSYERSLPGVFASTAYYGRGWALSAFAALKVGRSEFDFRLGGTFYPWTVPSKPSAFEAGFQYSLKF